MIRYLHIKNLALVESAEIVFEKGLNVFTGETGAGKTIILTALSLILGSRAQNSLLRTGADKASIEASFELANDSSTRKLLEEMGVEAEDGELLTIRRELTSEGKSRAQINCQTVPLPLLQKVGSTLCDLIDQSSHQELKQLESQRNLLDLYAGIESQLKLFKSSWEKEKEVRSELGTLLAMSEKRDQESDFLTYQLEELQEVCLHEEESCFAEYQLLSKRAELLEKVHSINAALSDSPQAILTQLARLKGPLESIVKIDPSLEKAAALFQEAFIPLKEVSELLGSSLEQEEADPKRLAHLEERLSKMHLLKRKIGKSTREEIESYEEGLKTRLETLASIGERLKTQQVELSRIEKETDNLAAKLTDARQKAASIWQKELTTCLQSFNMPSAELKLEIRKQPRGAHGDDHFLFSMRANRGEALLPIQACASGGELSRLLLSIKTTLAEKNCTPILIFDEIDANVGGETATLIGAQLKKLAEVKQLICVTHFPQVARFADQHLQLKKSEEQGRTTTTVTALDKREKEKELLRMLGGAGITLTASE